LYSTGIGTGILQITLSNVKLACIFDSYSVTVTLNVDMYLAKTVTVLYVTQQYIYTTADILLSGTGIIYLA